MAVAQFLRNKSKKNGHFEIKTKIFTCGPAATKTSKVEHSLLYTRVILTFEVFPALGLLGKTYCPELKLITIFSICGIQIMHQPKENGPKISIFWF